MIQTLLYDQGSFEKVSFSLKRTLSGVLTGAIGLGLIAADLTSDAALNSRKAIEKRILVQEGHRELERKKLEEYKRKLAEVDAKYQEYYKELFSEKTTSKVGIDLIKKYEGFKPGAYRCSAGVWTIGYGTTHGVKQGEIITRKKAEEHLLKHLSGVEKTIEEYVTVNLTQNQYDALASFIYNVGEGNFVKSTLLKRLNKKDTFGAAQEFPKWKKANGTIFEDLKRRRAEERALFLK